MRRSRLAVGVAVTVVALAVVGAALVTGFGPAPGGNSKDIEHFPTQTPGPSGSDASLGGTSDSTDSGDGRLPVNDTTVTTGPPFTFDVADISSCGETCRDVTASLTNEQSTAASDVVVYTRIFLGNGTDGPVVWQGTRSVGTLDANESVTVTTTVALTAPDGLRVRNNGGHITARSSVDSDDGIVTVTKRRDVL